MHFSAILQYSHETVMHGNQTSLPYPDLIRRDVVSVSVLKEEQGMKVMAFLDGKDDFILHPTGIGKSLFYQLVWLI